MAETIITVRGSASDWFDAERATLEIQVAHDGPKRAEVFAATTEVGNQVAAALAELDGQAVTRWSSDRVRVWSNRPWNSDGKRLPPVYYAALGATARFADFDALAGFVETFAVIDGVTISSLTWELTEERHQEVTKDINTRAIRDAVSRATTYAHAAGLGTVTPVALADPGLLGEGRGSMGTDPVPMVARGEARMGIAGGSPTLSLAPDRIRVEGSVEARFHAS